MRYRYLRVVILNHGSWEVCDRLPFEKDLGHNVSCACPPRIDSTSASSILPRGIRIGVCDMAIPWSFDEGVVRVSLPETTATELEDKSTRQHAI